MPTEIIRQTMFTTGEVDETVWKRSDVAEYLTSAQSLLNLEVSTTGLAKKRKGMLALINATTYLPTFNSRMYEFVDKNGNYYIVMSVHHGFIIFFVPSDEVFVVTSTGSNVITGRDSYVVAGGHGLDFAQFVSAPYDGIELSEIDYSQDDDTLIVTHPLYPPARIYISDYSPLTFAYEVLNIYPLPAYDFGTIDYNNFDVHLNVSGDTLNFRFENVGADPGFNDAWIGGQILGGGISETQPIGYAIIQTVDYDAAGGGVVTFSALIQQAFLSTPGEYAVIGSQYSVKQPAWVQTPDDPYNLGYPAKVLYLQNRLWFGNTRLLSNTLFGSKINAPINFDVGTGRDNEAIIYKIGESNAGEILWMNGGKQLEVFCKNFEFSSPQSEDAALTPSTFSMRKQSSYGSSTTLKPQTYINDSYFAARTGKALINYHFNGVGLAYASTSISIASSHLVKNPRNRALLRGTDTSQDNFIYFLNPDDNTLTTFQFAAEYKLAALTPVTFQDNIKLIDIVTVNNAVYLLKFYELTNQYTIEVFDEKIKIDSQENATMDTSGLVTGLDRFNGYTIQVVYKNQDFGKYLVINGEITVNNPNEIDDTIQVGFLYDVELRAMYPFGGAQNAPLFKNITNIYVDYFESLNFYINNTFIPYQSFADIRAGLPLVPKTDTAILTSVNGWSRFDRDAIVITQSSPFDLQILGIAYQIDVAVI